MGLATIVRAVAASFHSEVIPASLQLMFTCASQTNRYSWLIDQYPAGNGSELSFYSYACDACVPSIQTSLNCFLNYSIEEPLIQAVSQYSRYCKAFTGSQISEEEYYSIWQNATGILRDVREIPANVTLTVPVILSDKDVRSTYEQFRYVYYNFVAAFNFSVLINVLVALFILFMFTMRFFNINNKMTRYIRSKLIVPPVFGVSHHSESNVLPKYRVILPTRGETLTLTVFIIVNIILAAYNYPLLNIREDSKYTFLLRCVANRTGGLSFGLIPLMIILAGRNSIIQQLTGMPYSSMIFYHKWVARAMTLYGFIHGTLWIIYALSDGLAAVFFYYLIDYGYWRWGMIIMLASVFLVVHSLYALKSFMYETFLVTHIVLAIIFLIGCLKHCADFGWLGWIYLAGICWIGERIMRLWRVYFLFGGYRNAYARIISLDDEIFKITIPDINFEKFKFFPGCYGYLYVHHRKWFWQSHPFTLMKATNNLEITIKAKQGFTKELFDLLPTEETTIPIRVALEGPYGHQAPIESYSELLIVSSGTGIPGPISYLAKAIEKPSSMKFVHFFWIVPHESYLAMVHDKLNELFCTSLDNRKTGFSVHFYVTRPRYPHRIQPLPSKISLHYEKPNVKMIINQCIEKTHGSMAVISCANPRLDDFVRCTVAEAIPSTNHRVDYYDELQVW